MQGGDNRDHESCERSGFPDMNMAGKVLLFGMILRFVQDDSDGFRGFAVAAWGVAG